MFSVFEWFEKVDTCEKNYIFEEKWKRICLEKKFRYISTDYDIFNDIGIHRYLIKGDKGEYVGTVEFVKFSPGGYSILEHFFRFSQIEELVKRSDSTYECGKISIDADKRQEGHLEKIITCIVHFYYRNQLSYCIGVLEGKLFRTLNRYLNLQQVGDEIFEKTYSAVPILIEARQLIKDFDHCKVFQRKIKHLQRSKRQIMSYS